MILTQEPEHFSKPTRDKDRIFPSINFKEEILSYLVCSVGFGYFGYGFVGFDDVIVVSLANDVG